jgi:hypothetical protein
MKLLILTAAMIILSSNICMADKNHSLLGFEEAEYSGFLGPFTNVSPAGFGDDNYVAPAAVAGASDSMIKEDPKTADDIILQNILQIEPASGIDPEPSASE